jgi:hypothetical protein
LLFKAAAQSFSAPAGVGFGLYVGSSSRPTGAADPQLPMTETAWASVMQRKAASHLKSISEDQS